MYYWKRRNRGFLFIALPQFAIHIAETRGRCCIFPYLPVEVCDKQPETGLALFCVWILNKTHIMHKVCGRLVTTCFFSLVILFFRIPDWLVDSLAHFNALLKPVNVDATAWKFNIAPKVTWPQRATNTNLKPKWTPFNSDDVCGN